MIYGLILVGCGGDDKDTIPPAIRFSFPAEFTILSGVETIRAIASDNVKIKQVKFALDGETLEVLVSAPYTLLLNTTAYADCTTVSSAVSLTAVAEDETGNKGVAERLFYLDNEGLPPLAVKMLPAGTITKHTATLAWEQSVDFDFSHYMLYRDTSETVTQASDSVARIEDRSLTIFTDNGDGVTPFGLDENSGYNYRVYVHDKFGRSTPSDSVTRVHTLLPQPVSLTIGTAPTKYTALLSWTAGSIDVLYYRLHRGPTEMEADLDSIDRIEPTASAYLDTGLTASSDYFYYLHVIDSAAYADTFSVTNVLPVRTDSLDAPILVPSAQGVSKYSATLQWLRVPVQEDSSWITLYRSTTGSVDSNSTQVVRQNVAGSGILYTDDGLSQGQNYQFAMRHHDSRNNIQWSDVVELTTLNITDVWSGGLGVSDQQKYSLGLSWTPYTYLPDDFAGYALTRDGGGEIFTASASGLTSYTDTGLQRKTTYRYTLTVTDTSGAQDSATAEATTGDILPAKITLVEPTVLWFFKVAWLPSAEPPVEFDHYAVVRSNNENEIFDDKDGDDIADCVTSGDCALVAVISAQQPALGDTITYEDNDPNLITADLTALPVYRYAVLTYDIAGGYNASNIAGDTLYAEPTAVTLSPGAGATATTIPLTWTKADWNFPVLNTLLFSRYEVWRNDVTAGESPGDAGTTYHQIGSVEDIDITNFTDAGDELEGGRQLAYRIVLVDKVGRSAISNEITPATLP
ncbi:MAG: hypothetical protein IIA59_11865 [Candidatus Marinimicrobia bacterium]|nr:hypothetical protein [Candidatus Neomarinimicrobiota bacterium]